MALKETTRVPRAFRVHGSILQKEGCALANWSRERSDYTQRALDSGKTRCLQPIDGNPDTWTLVDSVYVAGFVPSDYIHDARAGAAIIYFFFKIDGKRKT